MDSVMWTLRHWCNQAPLFDRQRTHIVPYQLDQRLTPAPAVVEAQKLTHGPLELPQTDAELDSLDAQGAAPSQSAPSASA
eukprot:5990933-Alexandrium_andersonii.AAC.1